MEEGSHIVQVQPSIVYELSPRIKKKTSWAPNKKTYCYKWVYKKKNKRVETNFQ